jgi:hypothetical protein
MSDDPFAPIDSAAGAPARPKADWLPVLPVPADAPRPPASHSRHGKPTATWVYRDAQDEVLGYGLLIALPLASSNVPSRAQNVICPTPPPGDSSNKCASTAFVQNAVGGSVSPVTKGGTGQTSFTPNLPLIGNGTSPIAQGTASGNTTSFATTNGGLTSGNCAKFDALGNVVDAGQPCGVGGGNTPRTQDFIAGTNFTPGTTTSLTLSSAPSSTDLLTVTFDGIAQSGGSGTAATWSLSGAVVTFNAAIPTNTQSC